MTLAKALAQRRLAAVLSLSGVVVLLIASRLIITSFVVVGFVVLVLNLVEKVGRGRALAEIVGAVVTWGFTALLFNLAYAEFLRRDSLQTLPELYAQTVGTSLAGILIFVGGVLDWRRKSQLAEG